MVQNSSGEIMHNFLQRPCVCNAIVLKANLIHQISNQKICICPLLIQEPEK